ncbi:hypothetical protein ACH4ZX_36640 [Streptomyces sp. NPDC020490]|uniref:hypothetical protein n=1 Tax=Streptomyces sp. NPDC020490 TaxID=3365078 RepID=UPI0037BD9E70
MTTDIEMAQEADVAPGPGLTTKQARRLVIAERVLYTVAGTWAAAGPVTDVPWWAHGAVVLTGYLSGWRVWKRADGDSDGLLLSVYRSLPVLGWSGTYTAGLLSPVFHYPNGWPMLTAGVWTLGMAAATPWTRSRGLRRAIERQAAEHGEEQVLVAAQAASQPTTFDGHVKAMWAASPATGETWLESVKQDHFERADFSALVLAPAGQAVPSSVTSRSVAAVFDVPEQCVSITGVDGYGPGRLQMRVAPSETVAKATEQGLKLLWEQKVSGLGGAAPGMELVDYRLDKEAGTLRMRVAAADGELISLPRLKLARALKIDDPELLMIETDGLAHAVVTVYREHPLLNIREATVEDLTMGEDGRIAVGLRHDGRLFKMPLYDPEMGALTDLVVGAMGSGKSVFLLTVLIAERLSGVISLVADAQSGMSLPEANGRVRHFGAGLAAMAATLAAACAVADYREKVSSANGWGSFVLGDPWRLVNVTLDEINLAIGEHAICPPEFSKWIVAMIARIQQTGRKFGFGIRFAGQSIHVADLGDAEKLRANARQGTVWMGRVNSTMTQSMATDMVSDGTDVTPIRRFFGSVSEELEAAWDGKEVPPGPITAGMAWGLQGGRATLMRVFKALKRNKTYPHLIRLFESAPEIPGFTPEEDTVFKAAYAEALIAADALLTPSEGDEEEGGKSKKAKKGLPQISRTGSFPAPPKTLRDRVLEALADGEPRRVRDIRTAVGVGTEGGPSSGSVDNTLSKLAEEGRVVRVGHGTWALAPHD